MESPDLSILSFGKTAPTATIRVMNIPYGPLLVVEDIEHIRNLLAVTLRFKGYPVVTAANGEEALTYVHQEHPAAIITDILMPRMDGYTLTQKLRHNPQTNQIPIIFLSATYVTPEDKEFALQLGAMRFLEKPVDTEEFLLTIAEVLTLGPPELPPPLEQKQFYLGYRQRLENKLHHKNTQIARVERLLTTLPLEQKPAFQSLLEEASYHKREIETELNQLYNLLTHNGA